MTDELVVHVADGPGCRVVTLSGTLSQHTAPAAQTALRKLLLDRGCAVVGLADLRLAWEPHVEVFPAVLAAAGGWPAARMALHGAPPALAAALRRSRVTEGVPLCADLPAALERVRHRPQRVRRRAELPLDGIASQIARLLVRDACTDWQVPAALSVDATLVVGELAANAVLHAGTPSLVVVELTDRALTISVRDYRPDRRPHARPPDGARGGLGLHLVATLAQAWGVTGHPDGKTVWGRLRLR